jgi:hypothetical protein
MSHAMSILFSLACVAVVALMTIPSVAGKVVDRIGEWTDRWIQFWQRKEMSPEKKKRLEDAGYKLQSVGGFLEDRFGPMDGGSHPPVKRRNRKRRPPIMYTIAPEGCREATDAEKAMRKDDTDDEEAV